MSTAGVRAGKAFVEITTNNKALQAGLAKAQQQLQAFGDGVRATGLQLAAAGVAAALPFAASTKTFAEFEKTMSRVQALTNASTADFAKLNQKAKDLGEETVFSATQAAQAMSFFALAGFDVKTILDAIGPTLNLAAAGQLDIAEAADITAKIMAGLGIEAKNVGNAVDVLTKAMTTANTDLRQLGDAMKFVGPIAKSVGISIEDITASIQLLSNAGIQGEMAGTTMRGALLALTDPSKEAADLMRQLGIQALDASGNVRPLADIVDNFNKALEGMGQGAKLGAIGRIFDARQAAGFVELMSQGGDAIRKASKALQSSDGTAARIAGTQINNLAGDAIIATSAFEGLQIAVGEALVAPLRVLIRAGTQVIATLSQWVRDNRVLVAELAAAASLLVLAGGATLAFGVAVKVASVALAAALLPLKAFFAVLAIATSPIGLVTAGVVGLYAAFINFGDVARDVGKYVADVFVALRERAHVAIEGIGNALKGGNLPLAAKILWLSLQAEWARGIQSLGGMWANFEADFLDSWSSAVQVFAELFITAVGGMQTAWVNFKEFVENKKIEAKIGLPGAVEQVVLGAGQGLAEVGNMLGVYDDRTTNQLSNWAQKGKDTSAKARAAEMDAEKKRIADEAQRGREAIVGGVRGQIDIARANRAADAQARRQAAQGTIDAQTGNLAKIMEELAAAIADSTKVARAAIADPKMPNSPASKAVAAVTSGTATLTEANQSTTGTFSARGAQAMGGGAVAEIKKSNVTLAQMREILQRLYAASGTLGGLT